METGTQECMTQSSSHQQFSQRRCWACHRQPWTLITIYWSLDSTEWSLTISDLVVMPCKCSLIGWALVTCPQAGPRKGDLSNPLQLPEREARSQLPFILDSPKQIEGLDAGQPKMTTIHCDTVFSLTIANLTNPGDMCKRLVRLRRGLCLINYCSITSSLPWFTWISSWSS